MPSALCTLDTHIFRMQEPVYFTSGARCLVARSSNGSRTARCSWLLSQGAARAAPPRRARSQAGSHASLGLVGAAPHADALRILSTGQTVRCSSTPSPKFVPGREEPLGKASRRRTSLASRGRPPLPRGRDAAARAPRPLDRLSTSENRGGRGICMPGASIPSTVPGRTTGRIPCHLPRRYR